MRISLPTSEHSFYLKYSCQQALTRKYFTKLSNGGNILFFFWSQCLEAWNLWNQCKLSFGQLLQWVMWDVTPSSISHIKRRVCHVTEWNSKTEQITEKKMMIVDLPWKGTSGYNKNNFVVRHWQWILQCSLFVEGFLWW